MAAYLRSCFICSTTWLLAQTSNCITLHVLFSALNSRQMFPIIHLPQIWREGLYHWVTDMWASKFVCPMVSIQLQLDLYLSIWQIGRPHIKPTVGHNCILAISSGTNSTKSQWTMLYSSHVQNPISSGAKKNIKVHKGTLFPSYLCMN